MQEGVGAAAAAAAPSLQQAPAAVTPKGGGLEANHAMGVLLSEGGVERLLSGELPALVPPVVVQQFEPHGQHMFKVRTSGVDLIDTVVVWGILPNVWQNVHMAVVKGTNCCSILLLVLSECGDVHDQMVCGRALDKESCMASISQTRLTLRLPNITSMLACSFPVTTPP